MFWAAVIVSVITSISGFVSTLYLYRNVFVYTGLFFTRKFKPAQNQHKYAIMIAARNEAPVIGNLIRSIRAQDYPAELIDIFVVADNCTDNTADICRELGAYCYERFDTEHRTKGFALQFLVENIKRDFGIYAYEAYIIFDADNLLKQDYMSRMNDSFDAGEKIVTSYRNTKNFDTNWISASYAIHWLRTIRKEHRARSVFRLATRIQGTGFLFAAEIIENGWPYTSLTEDRAFCADAVANGYKISYNNDAIFYDEQPVDIKIAMRQRIRWAKGHLQAFVETGPQLFWHIFVTHGMANRDVPADTPRWKRLVNNLRLRFMSFDMLTVVYPRQLVSFFKRYIVLGLRIVIAYQIGIRVTAGWAPTVFQWLFRWTGVRVQPVTPGQATFWMCVFVLTWIINSWLDGMLTAAYVLVFEHRRIPPMKLHKQLWFIFTFPIFDLIGKISMVIALFSHVEWKPIPHNASISIDELEQKQETIPK